MTNTDFLPVASEIARDAGALLLKHLQRVSVEYKGEYDIVTAADRAAEDLVVGRLKARFPSHSIVAEEGTGVDRGSEYVWYVDPLDGTTNFAHGVPVFAVSIGLEKNGERIVGVVYDPSREEFFTAEKGAGAYLNNRRIRVSTIPTTQAGLFASGFPAHMRNIDGNIHYFHQISALTHGGRRFGSAALDLCWVACGRLEGVWEFGLKSWDVSAGLAIIEEAGGRVTDMAGDRYRSGVGHMAATNGLVHDELLALFARISNGEMIAHTPSVQTL